MPANRTSIGTALNDTAQEVGTSVGTAVVGTMVALVVTKALPSGGWGADLLASFFRGERITFIVLAVIVGVVAPGEPPPSPTRARSRSTRATLPSTVQPSSSPSPHP